jgi:hypothetical protein
MSSAMVISFRHWAVLVGSQGCSAELSEAGCALTPVAWQQLSISFCRFRFLTLARCPSCTGLKIRCRSRRTVSSWARQRMASPIGLASPTRVRSRRDPSSQARSHERSSCPTCLSVPVDHHASWPFMGSPVHVSALTGPACFIRHPASYPHDIWGGAPVLRTHGRAGSKMTVTGRVAASRRSAAELGWG